MILAISSQVNNKLQFEQEVYHWKEAGLLKPSLFKASIATIEKDYILTRLGTLNKKDISILESMLKTIC